TFGDVTVTLRAVGANARLTTGWWKPGFDYPARMASDGVLVNGTLELVLSGLSPGRHSLATYHNTFTDARPGRITVAVQGGGRGRVPPTSQARQEADGAWASVEFAAGAGKGVVVTSPRGGAGSVVLNGFEIARSAPARGAANPAPSDDDEHAPEDPVLA